MDSIFFIQYGTIWGEKHVSLLYQECNLLKDTILSVWKKPWGHVSLAYIHEIAMSSRGNASASISNQKISWIY